MELPSRFFTFSTKFKIFEAILYFVDVEGKNCCISTKLSTRKRSGVQSARVEALNLGGIEASDSCVNSRMAYRGFTLSRKCIVSWMDALRGFEVGSRWRWAWGGRRGSPGCKRWIFLLFPFVKSLSNFISFQKLTLELISVVRVKAIFLKIFFYDLCGIITPHRICKPQTLTKKLRRNGLAGRSRHFHKDWGKMTATNMRWVDSAIENLLVHKSSSNSKPMKEGNSRIIHWNGEDFYNVPWGQRVFVAAL